LDFVWTRLLTRQYGRLFGLDGHGLHLSLSCAQELWDHNRNRYE
jgi:hypothetical protein